MKRFLLFALVVGLFAGQASAAMYEMDATTALGLSPITTSAGDGFTLKYIGSNPGTAAGDKEAGSDPIYGETMLYAVGFTGDLSDFSLNLSASQTFGLSTAEIGVLPVGPFTGFVLPISNDDNQGWNYRTFVTTSTTYYSPWGLLAADTTGAFTTALMPETDFSTLTGIGFEIKWIYSAGDSIGDTFHTSVVPVPGAILLGMLGLSVAGIKLRKFA